MTPLCSGTCRLPISVFTHFSGPGRSSCRNALLVFGSAKLDVGAIELSFASKVLKQHLMQPISVCCSLVAPYTEPFVFFGFFLVRLFHHASCNSDGSRWLKNVSGNAVSIAKQHVTRFMVAF